MDSAPVDDTAPRGTAVVVCDWAVVVCDWELKVSDDAIEADSATSVLITSLIWLVNSLLWVSELELRRLKMESACEDVTNSESIRSLVLPDGSTSGKVDDS